MLMLVLVFQNGLNLPCSNRNQQSLVHITAVDSLSNSKNVQMDFHCSRLSPFHWIFFVIVFDGVLKTYPSF